MRLWQILILAIVAITNAKVEGTTPWFLEGKISPEILNELKDFRDLIPAVTVDELIAEHILIDPNFRHVMKYVKSSEFTVLMGKVQKVPEVLEILNYLHLLVNSTEKATTLAYYIDTDRDAAFQLSKFDEQAANEELQLEFVLLNNLEEDMPTPLPVPQSGTAEPITVPDVRSFSGFVEELIEHLPKDQYVDLINEKCQKNAAFAQFYAALRSSQFRPMVDDVLKCANLAEILKIISSNGIDTHSLEATAFKVISWGPHV